LIDEIGMLWLPKGFDVHGRAAARRLGLLGRKLFDVA
jgi:hypothetical protein